MKTGNGLRLALAGLLALSPLRGIARQSTPYIPDPGVPERVTLEGNYVRVAYNHEGYVTLGYRVANADVGSDWMLLEIGVTLREGAREFALRRQALSLVTPDGTRIPLPTIDEFRKAGLQALDARADVLRDSVSYFRGPTLQSCVLGFFFDQGSRPLSRDEVVVSHSRGCIGRIYFKVPGGITYGQHWLDVQFENSLVRVPFRIMTRDEEKWLSAHFTDIKKQVDEAFRK